MADYARMYRFGITPWERYRTGGGGKYRRAAGSRGGRALPPPRPCPRPGLRPRGVHPRARAQGAGGGGHRVRAGRDRGGSGQEPGTAGLSYVVGDVTRLPSAGLGTFGFFLDIGCFQGLDARQRLSQGEGVTALANPGATVLMLSFGPGRWRRLAGGVSQEEVQTAFAGWELLAAEPADTTGLGWPMNKTAPHWYRLRRPT